MAQAVKIRSIKSLTHDVLQIVADRPTGLKFTPGQAVDVSINKDPWQKELRPFTFVSQPEDDQIEFNIKTYTDHKGVTNELRSLKVGDELLIGEVFGNIHYEDEGIFLAGGAGLTPMLSIIFSLNRKSKLGNNKLIFANKTKGDIIREDELRKMLGKNFINILSNEEVPGYEHGYVSADLIKKNLGNAKYFYVCGPKPFQNAVKDQLKSLGVNDDHVIWEK